MIKSNKHVIRGNQYIQDTAWAVRTVANRMPVSLTCLPQALDVKYLLRHEPDLPLNIGVQPLTGAQRVNRFRKLLVRSVQAQTTGYSKVAASLSGGLDSPVVCGVAQSLRETPTHTFNFDTATPEAREDTYIDAVVETWELDHRTLHQRHSGYEAIRHLTQANGQPILILNYSNQLDNIEAAQRQGCDVFLSGHWGDQVMTHGFGYLYELAANKDWPGLRKAVEQDAANSILGQVAHGRETAADHRIWQIIDRNAFEALARFSLDERKTYKLDL